MLLSKEEAREKAVRAEEVLRQGDPEMGATYKSAAVGLINQLRQSRKLVTVEGLDCMVSKASACEFTLSL